MNLNKTTVIFGGIIVLIIRLINGISPIKIRICFLYYLFVHGYQLSFHSRLKVFLAGLSCGRETFLYLENIIVDARLKIHW